MTSSPLIVALDTDDLDALVDLAAAVAPHAGHLKVGLEAFTAHGPAAVRAAAEHRPVFLDLKLHDIPTTVARAAAAAARLDVAMLTVHASGGGEMIAAALDAAPDVTVLAVTVLTSLDEAALAAVGQPPPAEQVVRLATMATATGAGIVCSPADLPAVRAAVGPNPVIVTPGIREVDDESSDQRRIGTAAAALAAGATHIVVGRPITRSPDPAAAARAAGAHLRRLTAR